MWPKGSKKFFETDEPQEEKCCLSLRILFFSNLLAGHWFAVSALRIRSGTLAYVLSYIVFFFSHAVMIAYTYVSIKSAWNSYVKTDEIKVSSVAMSFVGILGIVLAFWRTCCIIVNQHKMMNLVANILNSDNVDRAIISKAARKCIMCFISYLSIYCTFVAIGTRSMLNFGEILYDVR